MEIKVKNVPIGTFFTERTKKEIIKSANWRILLSLTISIVQGDLREDEPRKRIPFDHRALAR